MRVQILVGLQLVFISHDGSCRMGLHIPQSFADVRRCIFIHLTVNAGVMY